MEVKHTAAENKGKFALEKDNEEIGEMTYVLDGNDSMDINHTWIDDAYRGKDLGLNLIEAAAAFARANSLKIIPTCPYVAKVFNENDNYSDVIYSSK